MPVQRPERSEGVFSSLRLKKFKSPIFEGGDGSARFLLLFFKKRRMINYP